MGRRLSIDEHRKVLKWGESFVSVTEFEVNRPVGSTLRTQAAADLKNYWNLANLSRAGDRRPDLSKRAYEVVFKVRTRLECSLAARVEAALEEGHIQLPDLFEGSFFGGSIKQGVSVRMPLTSCVPTKECRGGCYAHDGMDAGHNPIVKGVLSGVIAAHYEEGDEEVRRKLRGVLQDHVKRAIAVARRENKVAGFQRTPRIRFSHVGEIAAFPSFANDLARLVKNESQGDVACVVYTRHPNAFLFDTDLFVVNFTLDRSSMDRERWAPRGARLTYSAWDGVVSNKVDVNFLEHHRFGHTEPSGEGKVCPTTLPETEIRTCDAVRCELCFTAPKPQDR